MYRSLFVLAALGAVLLAGCVPSFASGPATAATLAPSTPGRGSAGGLAPTVAPQAAEWLAKELNVAPGDLRLVLAERTEWTDSCFGLGGPAESCLQAMTPGWRITLAANGQQYEVRGDESGSNFRLAPRAS